MKMAPRLAIALAASLMISGCGKSDATHPAAPARRPVPSDALRLTVTTSVEAAVLDVPGTVASERLITVRPRVSAEILRFFVQAGDRVTQGSLLAELDDREGREAVRAAEAQAAQADRERQRARTLRDQGAVTEQALLAAETAHSAAAAQLERARIALGYTRITAPSSGVVVERHAEAGDLATPQEPILSLFNPERLRLEVAVPARLLATLTPGSAHPVTLEGVDGTWTARVAEVIATLDPTSRTRLVKLELPPISPVILPGSFGRLKVAGAERALIRIPSAAVTRVGQLERVEMIREDQLHHRLVRTGRTIGDSVEILSGLAEGEEILIVRSPTE